MPAANITTNIIGSGLGGLAVAIRLARQGHEVRVFEKNPGPGGKMNSIGRDNFRFDTGPSLLTLPELVEELLADAPENIKELFRPLKLEKICKYFFPDGTVMLSLIHI